jgi:hypothetical protein
MNDFQYERFTSLSDSDVGAYVEPFLYNHAKTVSQADLQRILSELGGYDEPHLVYAIELGADRSPATFAAHVPQYLAHEYGSVRCAASRFLEHLSDEYITQELVDSVRSALSSYPQTFFPSKDFFADVMDKLEKRVQPVMRENGTGETGKGTQLN